MHNVFSKLGLVLISGHDLMMTKYAWCLKHTRTFCLRKGQGLCFAVVMDNEGENSIRGNRLNEIMDLLPPTNMYGHETNFYKNTHLANQTFMPLLNSLFPFLRVFKRLIYMRTSFKKK